MTDRISRRGFLKTAGTAAVAAGVGLASTAAALAQEPKKVSPNERIRMALIGCGGMGMADLNDFLRSPEVEFVAACDVYKPNLQRALDRIGPGTKAYGDWREVVARDDIDAIVCATPDHWHALVMINACMSGKDVYCEKPISHNIREGRAMVDAARRYGRVVQVGTQQRSGTHFQEAVRLVREGYIGKIGFAQCWNVENGSPDGIGNPPNEAPPDDLDWNMWLGPAPWVPYNRNRCLYNFRRFWDYAGGKITDWGTHLMDIPLWAMNDNHPRAIAASGGKYVIRDNTDQSDTQEVIYDFEGWTLVYSFRGANARPIDQHGYGIQYHGSDGTLFVDRDGFEVFPEGNRCEAVKSGGSDQHWPHVQNFIDCVRTRERPNSDIEIGHYATALSHLGNIALWTGRKLYWDGENERFQNDPGADAYLFREMRPPWRLP